jgi:hypothetical protein
MQFPSQFPWVILLLVGLPILSLPLAEVFWLVMPPLQNYYLMAYLDSTERESQSAATTKVEWLYKTAPERQPATRGAKSLSNFHRAPSPTAGAEWCPPPISAKINARVEVFVFDSARAFSIAFHCRSIAARGV